ncbi:MAG: carboxypeptidase-like regulatory domain-containing protein [bacterium]
MRLHRLLLLHLTLALPLLIGAAPAKQSGRGSMHGYVAFDDLSYNEQTESAIRAKVELHGSGKYNSGAVYTATTDNHGSYDLPAIGMGQYTLSISAPDHTTYRIAVYIPSDFECRLATMLRKNPAKGKG